MNKLAEQDNTKHNHAVSGQVDPMVMQKIVQLLILPNDNVWQGRLLGLGSDGVTYICWSSGVWEPFIKNIATA